MAGQAQTQAFTESVSSAMRAQPTINPVGAGVSYPPHQEPKASPPQALPTSANQAGSDCPGCGEWLEPGSKFCGECGYRVQSKTFNCHLCGAPQEPGAKFCGECGSKFTANANGAVAGQAESRPTQKAWVARMKHLAE